MTYNIHHAEGLDGKVDLLRIAEIISRESPDVVALQEVDKGVLRTQRRDLPDELAALTKMTCVFSNNFHYQGGEYGNAILTRFPVHAASNLHYKMLQPIEQRGLLQVVVDFRGQKLVFMNTHLDYHRDDLERLHNVDEIKETLRGYTGMPAILCGDFNDVPGSRVHAKQKESFADTWEKVGAGDGYTHSSAKPQKRIDYIWIAKDTPVRAVKAWVVESDASDHLPLVAELELGLPAKPR